MHRRVIPLSTLVIVGALSLGGCDKDKPAENAQGGEKAEAAEEKAAEAKAAAEQAETAKKADDAKAADDEKAAELAALQAELDAANEALHAAKERNEKLAEELDAALEPEDDVAHEQPLEAGKAGPVSVANVELTQKVGSFGTNKGRHESKLSLDLTLNEKESGGLYAKASCQSGEEVFVDVTTVSNQFGDLGKMGAGETKRVDAYLFSRAGLKDAPGRCELSFDFGATEFSMRLADFCYEGGKVSEGKCAEPLAPAPKGEGKVVPFGFEISLEEAMSAPGTDKRSLHVHYAARFNDHLEQAPHMALKTACKVGDKVWAEVSPDFPHVKPFSLEHGEVVPLGHGQFWTNPLPGTPEWCQMDVSLSQGFGQPEVVIATACWKDGAISDAACRDLPPAGDPEPISPETLAVDSLIYTWAHDFQTKDKFVLNLDLAVTMNKVAEQWARMHATVSCDGKADKQHTFGPDLSQVLPGESFAVTMTAFWSGPLDGMPKQCEVDISAEKFGNDPAPIAKICINGDQAKLEACPDKPGEGKEVAVDAPTEVTF